MEFQLADEQRLIQEIESARTLGAEALGEEKRRIVATMKLLVKEGWITLNKTEEGELDLDADLDDEAGGDEGDEEAKT